MRSSLPAAFALLLVSCAVSAQPARRVSRRLAINHDEECPAVTAPLVSRRTTGRHWSLFTLDLLAMFPDSEAARPLAAVAVGAWAEQRLGEDRELIAAADLRLRVDNDPTRAYPYRWGHVMYSRPERRSGESAYYKLPRADLERIARARRVSGSVGPFTFAFGPEQMATLREFALYAARSPAAPAPRPGDKGPMDCDSYMIIVR